MPRNRRDQDKFLAKAVLARSAHSRKGKRTGERHSIPETREEAVLLGTKWYQMSEPCLHGHLDVRDTLSKMCRGCLRNFNRRRQQDYPRVYFWGAKYRAKLLNVPFTITLQDVRDVWPIDNRCPVFGFEFIHGSSGGCEESPSLDKIIPELGYVPGNIAIISRKANTMKSTETRPEAFRRLADWMESKQSLILESGQARKSGTLR